MANVLKDLGVGKGDRVVIYMPMIPEAAYAMLACARIGAAARPARYLVDSTLYFTPAFGPRRRAHWSQRTEHGIDWTRARGGGKQ